MQVNAFVSLLGYLAISAAMSNCRPHTAEKNETVQQMPKLTIEQVQQKYQDQWMAIPGVVGVGIGAVDDKPALLVMVVKKTPDLEQKIPKMIEGYPVLLEETGEIRALKRDSG
jgi:hypothetical protein